MTQTAAEVFRAYVLDGVPGSGNNPPNKREIVSLLTFYETLLGFSSGLSYATLATLQADIAHPAHTLAVVYNDGTAVNNGLYEKYGVSGAGSWTRVGDLPNAIVTITPTAGTANAVIATATETPTVPGTKLYLFTPAAPNTTAVTINVNGAGAVPIKNAFGVDLATGSLLAGSQVLMAWSVDHYQLLISASVDGSAILAAAVAAQTASAASATASAASASTAATYALAAGAAAARFVKIKTTANDTLSGLAARDGVTPVAGDKVLAGSQTTASQNGIYVAAAGAWSRASDFNASPPIQNGVVVNVSQGTLAANTSWVCSSPDVTIVVGTSALNFAQTSLLGDVTTLAFQQDGAGTVPLSVAKILKQWNTLQMYGGGPDKTAAQNAAAFGAARDAHPLGGHLDVTPGIHQCDPVNFIRSDLSYTIGMTIEGVNNPAGGANSACMIEFSGGASAGTFWNFDSPSAGTNNGSGWEIKKLYLYSLNAAYDGSLISSSTPVTDGSKITSGFLLEDCMLIQNGAGACILLNVGKNITSTIYRNVFGGGLTQIMGQQGQTVAGIAQARQNTTMDIRKNSFANCNGYPILNGGEGWGCYDNIFEATAGGRGRVFSTSANYPILNMTWINNWVGDIGVPGDQAFLFFGRGLVFMGNRIGGGWTGSGPGWNAIYLDHFKGFNISGNSFDYCSAAIATENAAASNYGSIEGNTLNEGAITTGTFGAGVRIEGNGV